MEKSSAWENSKSVCLEVGEGKVPLGRVRILVTEKCLSENLTSKVYGFP